MGFKARERKHKEARGEVDDKNKRADKTGELSCGIKACNGWADKRLGGRSISKNDVQDIWGDGSFIASKGRVKVCKPCYRIYKKETKDDKEY
ncbi:MAG: hypothetical protein QF707_07425 [Candidatus Poseidoniaceae archaeon]|jgi:hypothetical protein|nr:hypothetical protein [Candidatus Poseidoniaceae archaeon]MDP7203805.1 hypothetical protein [Candidatus Poseidoniaceae archaeon]